MKKGREEKGEGDEEESPQLEKRRKKSTSGQKLVRKKTIKVIGQKKTRCFNNYKQLQKILKYIMWRGEGKKEIKIVIKIA